MGRSVKILSALVAGTLAFVAGTSTAHALAGAQYQCQAAIAKEGAKYVNSKLKLIQKCKNANVATPGSCTAPDPAALQKLVDKLNSGLAKKCSFTPGTDDDNLAQIGFPGPCFDADPNNGFTIGDLQACILASHDAIISGECGGGTNTGQTCTVVADCPDTGPGTFCRGFIPLEYDPTLVGPIADETLKCQKEVAKNSAKYVAAVMKNVQKCRNALLNCKTDGQTNVTTCKASGIAPQSCATSDPKASVAIQKARDKAVAAITAKCAAPADLGVLKLCDPDQMTEAAAATCEADEHNDLTDNPSSAALPDLLDYQYAQRGVCGDNRRNQPTEECDGIDDSACPGQCGGSTGFFPCICQNLPRTRIVEHANSDLDNGWSGQSHDSGIVEGGGYVADLWDCDGPGGPDTICTVGPSCSLPPHSPCAPAKGQVINSDTICANLGQGTCRTTAAAQTGPHCEIEFKKSCVPGSNNCTLPGDRCLSQFHGAPLPLVSGGVAVCVVNTFTEDVVGTTDLATGAGAVRLRQNSATHQGGSPQQPCPVCGGFCSGPAASGGPGVRNLCTTNADCTGGAFCVTDAICSWGPDVDQPCRPNAPFGGITEFFGNPSKDCRRAVSDGSALGVIDITFNPATTGSTSLTANQTCGAIPGFTNKTCVGGANQHRSCTVNSECPGGTCNNQCFCPTATGRTQRPNGCQAACLGGTSDAMPCIDDVDCPGGFCHSADCRLNPLDNDSAQEGLCTVGPADKRCSVHNYLSCSSDAECQPPACAFCEPTETCIAIPRQCFVNPTIDRAGIPGTPDRTTGAIFCLTATGSSAVDGVAGLPGPAALTQPTTTIEVGF